MRLIAAIILTLIATLPAYAVDTVQVDRDGITTTAVHGSAAQLYVPATPGAAASATEVVRGDDPRVKEGINALAYSAAFYANNPLIADSTYHRRDPSRIIRVGSTYYWYYARTAATATSAYDIYHSEIAYATAPSMLGPWTEQGVLLTYGASGWDSYGVYAPDIVYDGTTYYLFYDGTTNATPTTPDGIGVATSASPAGPFVKSGGNPVLIGSGSDSDWDGRRTNSPFPLKLADGSWRLYYKGRGIPSGTPKRYGGYAYASAAEFPNTWHRFAGNPVFGNGVNGSPNVDIDDWSVTYLNGSYYALVNLMTVSVNGEKSMWFKSADGATSWTLTQELPMLHSSDMSGTTMGYDVAGQVSAPLDGEVSYIAFNGATASDGKDGLGLILLTRQAGNRPIEPGAQVNSTVDVTQKGVTVTVIKNGVQTAVDASTFAAAGNSVTWPSVEGIPYWSSGTTWAGAYSALNPIPANYVAAIPQSQVTNLSTDLGNKQSTLVSGTNIKTVEGNSLLGSGNIDLTAASVGLGNVPNVDATNPTNLGSGSGAISLSAGGTNQGIALTPSGTGSVTANGSLSILGTSPTVATGLYVKNSNTTYNPSFGSVLSASYGNGNPLLLANWTLAGTQDDVTKVSWGEVFQINNDRIVWQRAPASGALATLMTLNASGNLIVANGVTDNGSGAKLQVNGAVTSAGDVSAKTFTSAIPAVTTYGATTTIDLSLGDSPSVTLTGNPTLAFSNPKAGQWHRLNLVQDGTGSRTVTWPSTGLICTWRNTASNAAPTLLTGAGKVDTIVMHTLSTTSAECWTAGNK